MIASHRLASTWSRRASTQCRERSWVAERDLFKVRLKIGTYREVLRPSGHRAALYYPGDDRWAALSDAVLAAIDGPVPAR